MPMVMITCPTTDEPINTGMEMSEEEFRASTLRDYAVECPYCGHIHTWGKEDAYLAVDNSTEA